MASAFTLFEVLVSLAITGLIAFFVFSMSQDLISLWRQVGSEVTMEVDATFALDLLEKDIESALFVDSSFPSFAVDALRYEERDHTGLWVDAAGATRPPERDFAPARHWYGWAGSWLRLISAEPTVNAVSYQIIRRSPMSGSGLAPAYLLHRAVVRQDYTADAGYDILGAAYSAGGSYEGHPKEVTAPNLSSYLIENVVDFGVRLHVFDPSTLASPDPISPPGMRCIFPVFNPDQPDQSPAARAYPDPETRNPDGSYDAIEYPDAVEVFIRVLDSVGAERLQAVEGGGSQGSYADIVEQHGRLFHRFITCRVDGP